MYAMTDSIKTDMSQHSVLQVLLQQFCTHGLGAQTITALSADAALHQPSLIEECHAPTPEIGLYVRKKR